MTAKELYLRDDQFRILIDTWVNKKEIPFVLSDYLLDRDMVNQSECVRWGYDRGLLARKFMSSSSTYLYPNDNILQDTTIFYFHCDNRYHETPIYSYYIPSSKVVAPFDDDGDIIGVSVNKVILSLLDQWRA